MRSALRWHTPLALASDSTRSTVAAPLLALSTPREPEPAYRSSTRAPEITSKASRRENRASFTRSVVGLVKDPGTAANGVPPPTPEIILVTVPTAIRRRPLRFLC